MSIRAVVLDFDGVIADTEKLHFAAFRDLFALHGWVLDEHAYFERYLGCDDYGLVRDFARDHGIAVSDSEVDELAAAKAERFQRHLASADILFPGTKSSVEALAEHFVLGIASGALHHEIVAILRQAGLLDRFQVIVAADDVTATKPAPEPYLAAAAGLGIDPVACVAVEDSAAGLQAARSAGMRTIAVTTTSPRAALEQADRIVSGLHEVSPALVTALGSS